MFVDFKALVILSDANVYNSKLTSKSIIIVKKSNNTVLVAEYKLILFKLLSSIVIKNIENFFFLVKNYESFHSKNDMVSEAFIVLDKCLSSFDTKRNKQFYFYYNKSLTRAFIRLAEKHHFKHQACLRLADNKQENIGGSNSTMDFEDYYLDNLRLNDIEKKVFKSRSNNEKLKSFLEKNPDINSARYFQILSKIKMKFQPLIDEK